jgi:hypothetical protein
MRFFIFLLLLSSNTLLWGQQISGNVFEMNSEIPVEYVNIGIVGKNVGTISDQNGKYTLQIPPQYHNDTLRFSCIGYHSYSVKISDFMKLNNGNVSLEKRLYNLTEVVVRPKKTRQRTLGITVRKKSKWCIDYATGHEFGIVISNEKTVFIKELNVNFAQPFNSFDTIFFRINFYKIHKEQQFENILSSPIYIKISEKEIKDKVTIDLRHHYIVATGDFLVAFENINNLGSGFFCFYCSKKHTTYMRRASQGTWKTYGNGIGVSVLVDVER